jgi:hypothetical protein
LLPTLGLCRPKLLTAEFAEEFAEDAERQGVLRNLEDFLCDLGGLCSAISAVKGFVVADGNESKLHHGRAARQHMPGGQGLMPHGRWASDFSTLVSLILSTYNPTKNQESQRSLGDACAEGAGAPAS